MAPFAFILFCLVVFRISYALTKECGFLRVFALNRALWRVREEADPCNQPNPIAGILSCIFCASVWVGIIAAMYYFWRLGDSNWIENGLIYGTAASAVAMAINNYFGF